VIIAASNVKRHPLLNQSAIAGIGIVAKHNCE
jgi:hypothetical protein